MREREIFISTKREKAINNGVKNEQLKDSLNDNFFQKEKFIVNKSINSQNINTKIIQKDSIKKVSNIKYIILNIIFFSLFIKCNHKKIISASSYINVKIRGTDEINAYSKLYYGNKPNIIIINNKINYTNSAINQTYNLDIANNDINNITLIWNNPLTFTVNSFRDCLNITEIDFSNFDSSRVTRIDYYKILFKY